MAIQSNNAVIQWIEHRLPIFSFLDDAVGSNYPAPRNLSYWWNFGSLAGLVLVLQLVGLELATVSASRRGGGSVFVEGHVIARAIDRVWYIGVLIAIAVYVFQFAIFSVMSSTS